MNSGIGGKLSNKSGRMTDSAHIVRPNTARNKYRAEPVCKSLKAYPRKTSERNRGLAVCKYEQIPGCNRCLVFVVTFWKLAKHMHIG